MRAALVLLCIVSLLVTGCGKKGPLIPPEASVPAPIDSLAVEQKEDRFFVSWVAPTKDAVGRKLSDLAGFRVYRREVLPPTEDCEECPTAYRLVKTVDLDYPEGVKIYDNRYVFAESDLENGKTYQYKVLSFKKDGSESGISNKIRRKKVATPPAPRLKAISTPTGVTLEWEPGQTPGADSAGYNLYRRRGSDIGTIVILTPVPVKERRYDDLRLEQGVAYVYTVREVANAAGQLVEGAVSNEASGSLAMPE